MKNTSTPNSNFYCSVFGHDYKVSKNVTEHIKEYRCKRCHKQVTTNEQGNLTPLTVQLKEINKTLEDLYQKRCRHKLQAQREKRQIA